MARKKVSQVFAAVVPGPANQGSEPVVTPYGQFCREHSAPRRPAVAPRFRPITRSGKIACTEPQPGDECGKSSVIDAGSTQRKLTLASTTVVKMENLIQEWESLDSSELRLLLRERIGGPGQIDSSRDRKRSVLYLPLARSQCKIKLILKGKEIERIEPGPAFDCDEWEQIREEVRTAILSGARKVGREYSFCTFRVMGWWRGVRSGTQIVPPPASAPRCNVEGGDHPFILEFPLKASTLPEITNHRRIRVHRQMTLLLNVLLRGHTSFLPPRSRNLWATDLDQGFVSQWVSESFFAPLGPTVTDSLSTVTGEQVQEVEPNEYYATIGHDGGGLRVPSELDESICAYLDLAPVDRRRFDRAAFWLDMASRQWTVSVSSAVGALVTAVESLTTRGAIHRVYCDQCGRESQHDAPGSTQLFHRFFEKYAPGRSQKKQREEMYSLRSGIFHGSNVMQLDQDFVLGLLDPHEFKESKLTRDLWDVTRIAMRNWLRDPPRSEDTSKEGAVDSQTAPNRLVYGAVGVLAGSAAILFLRYFRQKHRR